MRVLMLGKQSSWMGLHLSHIEAAFRRRGHEIAVGDYHRMASFCGISLPRHMADERRQRSLERLVKRFQPDLIYCVASWKYDFPRLKSYYHGVVAIHDLDGPHNPVKSVVAAFRQVDLPLTASQYMVRSAAEEGVQAFYLPSAADPDYYAPMKLSYIGRATKRRVEFCSLLAGKGLALYGEPAGGAEPLRPPGPQCCGAGAGKDLSGVRCDDQHPAGAVGPVPDDFEFAMFCHTLHGQMSDCGVCGGG